MPYPKPYHLMTPAERTAHRIAENRKIDARVQVVKNDGMEIKKVGKPVPKGLLRDVDSFYAHVDLDMASNPDKSENQSVRDTATAFLEHEKKTGRMPRKPLTK